MFDLPGCRCHGCLPVGGLRLEVLYSRPLKGNQWFFFSERPEIEGAGFYWGGLRSVDAVDGSEIRRENHRLDV